MKDKGIKSVIRSLSMLEYMAQKGGECSISQLARELELPVSTAHRILGTLKAKGYVKQHQETRGYYPTMKLPRLGAEISEKIDLREITRPYLKKLSQESSETANLVVLDDEKMEVIYIDKVEGNSPLGIFYRIGHRAPFYCTGVGKILISEYSDTEIRILLEKIELKTFTENTITQRENFLEEIKGVRRKSYALDQQECERGACCIAAPLYSHRGRIIAAISISGPSIRLTPQRLKELTPTILEYSRLLSRELGYLPEKTL